MKIGPRVVGGGVPVTRRPVRGPRFISFWPAWPVCPLQLVLLVSSLLAAGCGYHVGGRGDRLPPDVKTIAVPIFTNQTSRFRIEQRLAAAVTREFIERTKFRVTPDPAEADAVLKGTVSDVQAGAVAFDVNTGRATALQITVTASIELTDVHTKQVLFSNRKYIFREEYQVSESSANVFEEDASALDRLSHDLARTLVTEILENF
ncbi:MAG TPA: LptE family protein [Terriglobia bacterium]|nr:LptE family protein [Terriglobia bacterium]